VGAKIVKLNKFAEPIHVDQAAELELAPMVPYVINTGVRFMQDLPVRLADHARRTKFLRRTEPRSELRSRALKEVGRAEGIVSGSVT
jgi:hypothetical protein